MGISADGQVFSAEIYKALHLRSEYSSKFLHRNRRNKIKKPEDLSSIYHHVPLKKQTSLQTLDVILLIKVFLFCFTLCFSLLSNTASVQLMRSLNHRAHKRQLCNDGLSYNLVKPEAFKNKCTYLIRHSHPTSYDDIITRILPSPTFSHVTPKT